MNFRVITQIHRTPSMSSAASPNSWIKAENCGRLMVSVKIIPNKINPLNAVKFQWKVWSAIDTKNNITNVMKGTRTSPKARGEALSPIIGVAMRFQKGEQWRTKGESRNSKARQRTICFFIIKGLNLIIKSKN